MRLKDKVAIVTGGAKGLGRAFALKMAEEGARVMVVTRKDMDNLKETVKRIEDIGGQAALFQADVSRETDTLAMARETADIFGRIDILVNNAAIYDGIKRRPFYEIDLAEWDLVMAVNVKGAFLAARAVFPYMKARATEKSSTWLPRSFLPAPRVLPSMWHPRAESLVLPGPWPWNWDPTISA